MSSHRNPPKPASMKEKGKAGTCRFCGKPTGNKTMWHPSCVHEFKLIYWPAETRKAVWDRDKGICARCGKDACEEDRSTMKARGYRDEAIDHHLRRASGRRWQHDHIRPLLEANGNLDFWRLDNIQTLCTPCHIEKGKEDNRRRYGTQPPSVHRIISDLHCGYRAALTISEQLNSKPSNLSMKLTIQTKHLLSALQRIQPITGKTTALPILACVRLTVRTDTVLLEATDIENHLQIECPAVVAEQGCCAISSARAFAAVSCFGGEETEIEADASETRLACGKQRLTLKGLDPQEFPVAEQETFGQPFEVTTDLLEKMLLFSSKEMARPVLCGVYWSADACVAADGRRLLTAPLEPMDGRDVIVPNEAVKLACRMGSDRLTARVGSLGRVQLADGDFVLTARTIAGEYVAYRNVIPDPQATKIRVTVDRRELASAVEFAVVAVGDDPDVLRIQTGEGCLRLAPVYRQHGAAEMEVPAECDGAIGFGIAAKYLLPALKAIPQDRVVLELISEIDPMAIRHDQLTAVVLLSRVQ